MCVACIDSSGAHINGNRKINRPRSSSKLLKSRPSKRLPVNQRLLSTRSARRQPERRRRLKKRKGRRRRQPFSGLSKPRKRYRLVPTPRRCFVYISSRVTARRGTSASLVMTRMWAGRLRRGICTRTLERTRLTVCIPLLCVVEACKHWIAQIPWRTGMKRSYGTWYYLSMEIQGRRQTYVLFCFLSYQTHLVS